MSFRHPRMNLFSVDSCAIMPSSKVVSELYTQHTTFLRAYQANALTDELTTLFSEARAACAALA